LCPRLEQLRYRFALALGCSPIFSGSAARLFSWTRLLKSEEALRGCALPPVMEEEVDIE
jgi:hypothetical protein